MSALTNVSAAEHRLAERVDTAVTGDLVVSDGAGGLAFANMQQVMEFAKLMAVSAVAVPKHLRMNPGACLAVAVQALEWRMSPYAVANKSYSVNDRLAYESQLIQAVILQRAPIEGRFKVEFTGEGPDRVCTVSAKLRGSDDVVEYKSPRFADITPKNSPLWKTDPDQQQFYYSGRALCRRHFPDVILGVYARDEIDEAQGPDRARDVTPTQRLAQRLAAPRDEAASQGFSREFVDSETGEITEGGSPSNETGSEGAPSDSQDAGADPSTEAANPQQTVPASDPFPDEIEVLGRALKRPMNGFDLEAFARFREACRAAKKPGELPAEEDPEADGADVLNAIRFVWKRALMRGITADEAREHDATISRLVGAEA
jgi:hypothetical protein